MPRLNCAAVTPKTSYKVGPQPFTRIEVPHAFAEVNEVICTQGTCECWLRFSPCCYNGTVISTCYDDNMAATCHEFTCGRSFSRLWWDGFSPEISASWKVAVDQCELLDVPSRCAGTNTVKRVHENSRGLEFHLNKCKTAVICIHRL